MVSYERGAPVQNQLAYEIGICAFLPVERYTGGSVHLQGYLAHKKLPPHRKLQLDYAQGPMAILGGGAVSHERGTPVSLICVHRMAPRRSSQVDHTPGLADVQLMCYLYRELKAVGFGVWGLGCGFRGLGFGVLGFGVWGEGLRVRGQGFGFWVLGV